MFGERPVGAAYYVCDPERRFEFIVWGAAPPPGDKLCLGLTGRTEEQLVQAILRGDYNRFFEGKGV